MPSNLLPRRRFISRASLMVAAVLLGVAVSTAPKAKAATFNWNQTAVSTYSWTTSANWNVSPYPNAIGDIANLSGALVGAQTVNLDAVITIGDLNFGASSPSSSAGYTLAAGTGGYLILDGSAGAASINKLSGSPSLDTISAGIQFNDTLTISNNSGGGVLTISGTLKSLTSDITFAGTGVVANGSIVVTGVIATSGNLIKNDVGITVLNATNIYAGTTAINGGSLSIYSTTGLPIRSAVSVASSAALDLNAAFTIGSLSGAGNVTNIINTAKILTIGRNDTSTTFTGRFAPTTTANIALTKIGAGILTLAPSAASTYTGNTIINGGGIVLDFANAGVLTSLLAATPLQITGGNFTMTGKAGLAASQTLGALTVGIGGGTITLIAGDASGTTLKVGAVTATASGGAVLIVDSSASTALQMGTVYTALVLNNRFVFSDGTANTYNWATNTAANTDTTGFSAYTPLPIAGGGLITTAYNLTASQAQTTTASTIRSLKLSSTSASKQTLDLVTFSMTLGGGTTSTPGAILIDGTANWDINGSTGALKSSSTTAAGDLIFHQYSTGTVTVNAGIADNAAVAAAVANLVKAGTGTLVLAGTNTFTGAVFVDGGTLSFSNVASGGAGSLGAGVVTAVTIRDGATLKYTGASGTIITTAATAGAHTFALQGGNATIDVTVQATVLQLDGIISGAGGLTKVGLGTLTLNAAESYTGPTIITAGVLKIAAADRITDTSPMSIGATGSFDMSAGNETVGSLAGVSGATVLSGATARTITFGGDNTSTTYSGSFTGVGASVFVKTGSGVMTVALSGTTAWTGNSDVKGGILRLGNNNGLPSTGTWTIANAAGQSQIDLNGYNWTSGAITLLGTGSTASSEASVNIGAGTLTLGGNVTYNGIGASSITTLLPAYITATGAGSIALSATRTFTIADSSSVPASAAELTVAAPISGAFGIVKTGFGNLLLSGANTFATATTTLTAGGLILDYTIQNNNKIPGANSLTLNGGGNLVLLGNASANTSQTVLSTTLASGGFNTVTLTPGEAQKIVLSMGAFTRVASVGTIRFNLPTGTQDATNGIITTTTNVNGVLGIGAAWATVTDASGVTNFAVNNGSNNIVLLTSTTKNDVTTWAAGDHVTDSTGFTGTTTVARNINTLRFNSGSASTVTLGTNLTLGVLTGGILQTANAANASILGGRLTSGTNELIFTTDVAALPLTVSSTITGTDTITKTGLGTLKLSGTNNYSGQTYLQGGTLQVSGGNAIGDGSTVLFSTTRSSVLELLSSETIGSLATGGNNALGGASEIRLGANTLTINQSVAGTYTGAVSGTGTLLKSGSATLTYQSNTTSTVSGNTFTGTLRIDQGQITMSGAYSPLPNVTAIILNGPTSGLLIVNDQTTAYNTKINDAATVTLNNTAGGIGFSITRTAGNTGSETVGALTLGAGHNVIRSTAGTAATVETLTFSSLAANPNHSTVLVRGVALGDSVTPTAIRGMMVITGLTGAVGGGGAGATTTTSIYPYMVGDTTDTGLGSSFVRDIGSGSLKPLTTAEYATDAAGYNALTLASTSNVRFTTGSTLTGTATAINSLVLDGASAITVTGPASGLQITSGAILSTQAVSNTINTFTGITTAGITSDYTIFVTDPSGTLTIASPLTTAAPLVKSGAGALVLSSASNAFTDVYFNQGALRVSNMTMLGAGTLKFFGGTLQLGAAGGGFTGDPSAKTITFGTGGGTLDTNGNNVSLANSLGSSSGSFTKAGAGTLTLNATSTLTGATVVSAGTLTLGANQAIGTDALTISGAATLAMGANNATVSGLTLSNAANAITGSGTLTVNGDASVNQGSIAALLAGSMNLFKLTTSLTLSQTVTLSNAANTFTGYTWIQDGTLSVTALANAGSNSSLGAATGDNASILIGNGAGTRATLAYSSASNSSSDRQFLLAGSTGGATIDSGSLAGLLTLSGGAYGIVGGAKSLTLQGSNGSAASPNIYSGVIADGAGTVGLTKAGSGTWSVTGGNTYTGATAVNKGILQVDFANATLTTNLISTSSVLTMGGGTFNIIGKGSTVNSQTFASTTLTAGTYGSVSADKLTATSLAVNLQALTRNTNSGINFGLLNGATMTVTGTTTTNGIITAGASGPAYATYNLTDWANMSGTNPVAATSVVNDTYTSATANVTVTASSVSPAASFSVNTLKFNAGGSQAMTLTGANALNAGGLLIGSSAGAVTISGTGTLSGFAHTAASGEFNIFQNSASNATISAPIINNPAGTSFLLAAIVGTTLNKFGTGTLILSSTKNAWTGGANIGAGTLKLGASNVLPNGISGTATGNLTIGTAGTLDLGGFSEVINGLAGSGLVDSSAAGTMTLTLGDNNAAQTFSGIISNTAGTLSLVKTGTGIQTLSGTNTYSGTTTISQGTLTLNFTAGTAQGTNLLPATALTLGSGTLSITGSTTLNIQSFSGTTLSGSAGVATTGTTPATTLNLGALTRTANTGATLSVLLGTSPTGSTTTITANTGTTILGGWAVAGATVPTGWAVSAGNGTTAGAITALGSYTTDTWAAGNNTDVVTLIQSPGTGLTTNSLRFNTSGAATVTLAGDNTITTGGILVTATVGSNNQTITGGNLQANDGGDLIIHNYNTSTTKTITINSAIIANAGTVAAENLVINSGSGTVVLGGVNTYTGSTIVNSGTLSVSLASQINSSSGLTLNGGTLAWTGADANQPLSLTLGAAGGTLTSSATITAARNVTGSTAVAFTGTGPRTLTILTGFTDFIYSLPAVLGDGVGGPTSLSMTYAADYRFFRLAAANTYTGTTTINRGVLTLSVANAISSGTGALTSAATTGNIIFAATGATNRAILEVNSTSAPTGITRSLGYGAGQIHWEGNGGFSNSSTATVVANLGGSAAKLTWGAGGFVPTSQVLQFGHSATITNASSYNGAIDFQNAIELGAASRTVDVAAVDLSKVLYSAILSGALTSSSGGGLTKMGYGTLLVTNANNASGTNANSPISITSGALIAGSLVFGSANAIPGSGANITFSNTVTNGAVGVTGDTNPISTLGSRIASPTASTTNGAFLLGADSAETMSFASYPNMRLAAYGFTAGTTPTGLAHAITYTGTLTPAGSTYLFGGQYALGSTAANISSSTLVLGAKNQLTGTNAVNFTYGQTTITGSNNYSGVTTFNGNALAAVRVAIGSNTAFGTSTITFAGTQTSHLGMVNGDHSVSNNIAFDSASSGSWEFLADLGTGGILRNTSQGAMSYLGTVSLGGRSNVSFVGRPGGALFLGDVTGGAGGINYTQGGGGYASFLSTTANGGVAKSYTGATTMGDNGVFVIDSPNSIPGNVIPNSSTILLQPGTTSVDLGTRTFAGATSDTLVFDTPVSSTLTIGGAISGMGTGGLNKQGLGIAILKAVSTTATTTGTLTVSAGTLRLDAATAGGTIWGASGQALTLGQASGTFSNGGTLEITGTSAQAFGTLTMNAKANNINLTGTMTLTLGATLTRTTGSTLNFSVPTGTVASTYTALNGLVYGSVTWNGNDWASANGTNIGKLGVIGVYTALTGIASAPTITTNTAGNYIISNTAPFATTNNVTMAAGATTNANTLKYDDSNPRTIDIGSGNTLRLGAGVAGGGVTSAGGILIASGAGALTIGNGSGAGAGSLTAGGTTTNTLGDLVFINNSTSNITVSSAIVNNGGTTGNSPVVYDGRNTGKLILAGANTFTGNIIINKGTVEVATVNASSVAGTLGQSTAGATNILLNGGTFRVTLSGGSGATDHGITVNAPSTIDVAANTLTINSTVLGLASMTTAAHLGIQNVGILSKTGDGTLEFKNLGTAANNLNLSIRVSAGTLILSQASTSAISAIDLAGSAGLIIDAGTTAQLGAAGTGGNQISDASSVVVNSTGIFNLNGISETIDGLAGNGIVQANGTATLTLGGNNSAGLSAYSLSSAAAGVNATGLNNFSGTLSDGSGTLALTKTGSGTQIISSAQSYSGATSINAGTLQLGIANALPSGAGKALVTIVGNNTGTNVGAVTTNGSDKVLAPGTLDMGGYNQTINGLASTTGGFVTNNPTLAYSGSAWTVAAGRQGTKTLSLGNSITSDASFNGVIMDGFSVQPGVTATGFVGAINLIKAGTNTQTLTGANTYSGTTVIEAGTLVAGFGAGATGNVNRLTSTTAITLGNSGAVTSGVLQLGDANGAVSQTVAGLATSGGLAGTNKVVGGNASNSTLILNQTGTSTYAGALGGAGTNQNKLNFTLQGGGTLTLNGANTLAGTTTVQGASTLILDSNLANSAVTVGGASAGTLVSNQTLSGLLTVGSGGVVAPGDVLASEIATLTLAGGLTLNTGGTLAMQIGSTATLTTPLVKDLITISGGALTLNAGGMISLSELTPSASVGALLSLVPGNYQLINYASASNFATIAAYSNATLNGLLSLTSSVIGSNNYYVTLVNNAAGFIELNVDNARFWSGATSGKWNTAVANWSPVNPALYLNTDKVLFQDTYPLISGNGNVVNSNIDVTTSVTPAALTFNNSSVNYTLSGTAGIGGSTGLTKSGTASLTISNANTFTGNTVISGGYVEMQHATALGTTAGSISVASGAALRLSGGIIVGAKATTLIGDGISSTGALRSISGNNSFAGAITLTGATRINSDADTLTLSGALNNGSSSLTFGGAGNVTVSGIIGSGSGALIVDGTGVVTLSNAANTYTGQTFIKNGTLSVSNIGSVSVAGGLGTPTTTGDGTIAIGDVANTGTLKWTGSSNESTMDRVIDLAGTTGGATIDASGSGVLTLTSAVTATGVGAKSLTLTGTGGSAGTPNVISSGISDGAAAVISLIKTGTGVWKLDAVSSYTGTTTIQNGTLLLGSVNQNFSALTLGGLSGGAATLALGSSGTATLTGDLTFSAANNPSGATISGSGTATLDLNAATRTFIVGSSSAANGADLTISAVIADALTGGALTKTGAGSLVLTGANTYVGTTNVDDGTLSVLPQAISSSLTINVGTNSTAGALNFYADGAIGDVNLASEANLNIGGATAAGGLGFNLSGSNADKITLAGAGALTVGATGGLINARALASLTPGSFTLIDATNNSNTATITGFTLGVLTGGYSYALDTATGGQLKLTVGTAAAGPYYWTGARSTTSWAALASSGAASNWATVSAAGTDAGATPGNIDVIFTLGTAVSTTLDQPYSLTGLTFAGSSAGNGNVTINAGSGDGILTLGANGITVSTGASSSATTIGTNVVLGSAQSWSVADSGQTLTVSGIISGNGNLLTKSGAGTLVLTGTNTFNGGLTADAGTVKVNNANSLGAGAGGLTLNNATLQATAGFTDIRNVTLGHANSAISVDTAQTLTYANSVSTKLTGSGVLNASGAGKLVLDDRLNANDFGGGSILSGGGTVQVYGLSSLGSGNITLNAATLQVSGTFTDARLLTVGNAASAISVDSGQTLTVSGKITGTGNLNASGAGVLVLNDSVSANDFIGNSVLSGGGTVQVASLTALGTGSITINAATLRATTSLSYSGKNFILGNAASTLTVASGDTFTITNSGSTLVSGSGKLNANVAGILILDDALNANTFAGGSVLSGGGTVKIKTLTSLGDETVAAALNDITLQATADITTTRNFTLGSASSGILVDSTKTFALSGNIVDGAQAGSLTKTGNGVLELSGTGNTFTGGTTVTAGTLKVSNASGSATGTGAVTVSGSSTTLSGAGTITGTATIASGSILSPGGTGTAGTLTLGGLTLASGSSLAYQLGVNTAASDKTIVTGSSLFTANGGAITLTGLSGLTSTTYNLITYSGTLSGTGFGALSLASNYVSGGGNTFYAALVNNTGSVDLTTTNTLTWNGNIAGTIWESGATANTNLKSGATTNLIFVDTMVVNFDDTAVGTTVNIVAAGVAPSAINVSASGGITFAGSASTGINGSTGITKTGSGTLTISNVNTYSGTTAIGGTGAIKIQNAGALGSGSITIANGASLLLDVGGTSLSSRLTAATGTGFDGNGFLQNLSGTNTVSTNFTAAMLTTASRIGVSGGTLNLDGTFASTNIALTLAASGTGSLSLGGASIALGTATLTITNTSSSTVTVANTVGGGTGGVSINGTGATTLNGALTTTSVGNGLAISSSGTNIINGNVTVTGATGGISVGGSATTTFGSSSVTSWNATGTAAISSSGDTTFNGTISGSGALTKTGTGTLTLAASNPSYSGTVTLAATGAAANSGLIIATANNALGTGAATLTFSTTGGTPSKVQLQLSGGITLGNSSFTTTGAGSNGTSTGLIRTLTGANVITNGLTMGGGGGSTTLRADTGSSLALNGAVTASVTGRYLTLVGGGNFTFGSAGSINDTSTTGTMGFWSQNSGSTTISSTANTYTLSTEIGNGNILTVASLGDAGANSSIGAAAATATNLVLDNGTLRYAGSTAQTTNRLFSLGANGATLDASGTGSGTMSFTGTGSLGFIGTTPEGGTASTSTAARTLVLTGTNTGSNTFAPVISDNTGATSLTKSAAGTWILLGTNNYTGLTTITNGTLQIGSGTTGSLGTGAVTNNATLSFGRTNSYTVSNAISGSGSLVQDGVGGTTILTGANSYDTTTITNGTLQIGSGTTGSLGSGAVTNNATLSFGRTNSSTVANAISGSGSLVQDGVGGTTILTGANSYVTTTITNGILQIGSGTTGSLGSGAVTNNATLSFGRTNSSTVSNAISGSGSLVQDGIGGTTILTGSNSYVTTTITNGTLQIGSGTTGSLGSGAVTNNATLSFGRTNSYTVSNAISGSGSLVQDGVGGTTILTGANSYDTTTITTGTLQVGSGTTGSLGSGAVTNNATLKFARTNSSTVANDISGSGSLVQDGVGGTTILTGANSYGTTTITNGTLQVGAGGTTGTLGSGAVTNNGTLAINRSNSYTIANNITGTGGLTKTGNGTLILSGANSYTGVTTLNGGTISVDSLGTGTGTSALGAATIDDVTKLVISGATINYTGTGGTYARSLTVGDGTFGLANNGSGALVLSELAKIDFVNTVGANRILSLSGANEGNNIFAAATFDIEDIGTARVFSQIIKDGVGTWILSGPKNRFRGDIRVNGGTLGFETGTLPDNQRISMADGAVLRWEAGNTDDISSKLNPDAGANVVLKVNGGSVTFAMDMIFVGTGATANSATARVTKSGASDLEITHSQSFTGGFTVNQGKLIATANGSLGTGTTIVNSGGTLAANGNNSSTDVNVNNGGILMGEGTLHAVNILTGGTLAPGASPGILIADSLVLGANSNFQWQVHDASSVAGTGWDKIMVTNNLNLSGVTSPGTRISINVMSLSNFSDTVAGNAAVWSKDDIHTLLFGHVGGFVGFDPNGQNGNYSSQITDYFSFDTSAFTTQQNTGIHNSLWSMSYEASGGGYDLYVTAVPEPSTYGFAIGALALAAAAIRRRKQKEKKV